LFWPWSRWLRQTPKLSRSLRINFSVMLRPPPALSPRLSRPPEPTPAPCNQLVYGIAPFHT
jgi:hypothetical protein